ncbi:hypothetical protein PQ469_07280 [Mucilaginibacter sp. KACC 22773]|uniref:hypothetical protein n=1 Tax=Mucilaginibacter sp. KACC 22773 TaxID=3025671 RepID=UPI0023671564|nr:hypothetical protein [Mucilaginibacter sp. KACC 22773]WDF79807.1 hypothetical protein PQ469_07280 [Mucilaginibacter sp. KACC 22773]
MMINSDIYQRAAFIRGHFINQVAFIEKMMEYFTAFHFCRDRERAMEMVDFLTGDRFVSFESKRNVFELVLEHHFKEVYNSNKEYRSFLTTIQNERNKLAHLTVLIDEQSIDDFVHKGSIYLIKFGEKTKGIEYSKSHVDDIMYKVNVVAEWVKDLVENNNALSELT